MVTCNTIAINKIQAKYALAVDVIADSEKAIADSGCTNHFLGCNVKYTNVQLCAPGVTGKLPNNMSTEASHTDLLDMPHIPMKAKQCHLFPDIGNKALLSITQFCDNRYREIFTTNKLFIELKTNPEKLFKGCKDPITRMWTINLSHMAMHPHPAQDHHSINEHQANNIYDFTLKRI